MRENEKMREHKIKRDSKKRKGKKGNEMKGENGEKGKKWKMEMYELTAGHGCLGIVVGVRSWILNPVKCLVVNHWSHMSKLQ